MYYVEKNLTVLVRKVIHNSYNYCKLPKLTIASWRMQFWRGVFAEGVVE